MKGMVHFPGAFSQGSLNMSPMYYPQGRSRCADTDVHHAWMGLCSCLIKEWFYRSPPCANPFLRPPWWHLPYASDWGGGALKKIPIILGTM